MPDQGLTVFSHHVALTNGQFVDSRMKMRFLVCAFGTSLTPMASAQEIIDGSGKDIPEIFIKTMIEHVSADVSDPGSLQFRKLRLSLKSGVCGEVNWRNGFGGYGVFTPFRADRDFATIIDPADIPEMVELKAMSMADCYPR